MPTPAKNSTAGYNGGGFTGGGVTGGKNNVTGYAGTGIGGPLDIGRRLFVGKEDYTPVSIAQSAQQDRRFQEGQINQAYDGVGRQKQYDDYLNSLRGLYGDQLSQQQQVAARNLKFANARQGVTGGSVAADRGNLLQQDYQGGLLTAADTARGAVDDLRNQDQAERRSLIALSNSASNVGAENSGTLASAGLGLQQASRTGMVQSLGDMFANLGTAYQQSQAKKQTANSLNQSPYGASGW
jgi:hypothetical protein